MEKKALSNDCRGHSRKGGKSVHSSLLSWALANDNNLSSSLFLDNEPQQPFWPDGEEGLCEQYATFCLMSFIWNFLIRTLCHQCLFLDYYFKRACSSMTHLDVWIYIYRVCRLSFLLHHIVLDFSLSKCAVLLMLCNNWNKKIKLNYSCQRCNFMQIT